MADRYLDFSGASKKLAELGITRPDGSPLPVHTVRTWADRGRLPFFAGPNGKRLISEGTIVEFFRKLQAEAEAAAGPAEPAPRRPYTRARRR